MNPSLHFYCSEKLLWNWFGIDSVCWLRLVLQSEWLTAPRSQTGQTGSRPSAEYCVVCVSGRAFSVLHHLVASSELIISFSKAERSSGVKWPGLKVTCWQKFELTSVKHNFPPYILFTLFFSSCVSEAEKESHGKFSKWH